MNTTIQFNQDGTAQCLCTEALPQHEIGRLEIACASPGMNWQVGNLLQIDHAFNSAYFTGVVCEYASISL
jgi:hypothetical protein